jgi:pimeloyl-ACP methyl ester carboxylesterase
MTKELHEAILKLGLNDYYLMGHSISGLYSVSYMDQYPNEVKGFIGIDSSVPTQDLPEDMGSNFVFKAIDFLGVYRLATVLSSNVLPESYDDFCSDEEIKSIKAITGSRMNNKSILSEMNEMINNFETVREIPVNEDIPVLIFLSEESIDSDGRWLEFHDDYYQENKFYERKILQGSHYLHHSQAPAIATYVNDFINHLNTVE